MRPLEQLLWEEPYRFEFFQAVRLLQLRGLKNGTGSPVGLDTLPSEEAVRFRTWVSLSMPASPIHSIDRDAQPPRMFLRLFSLAGRLGELPFHYTEFLLKRLGDGDETMAEFLDLFTHRMLSFYYRAWEKHHLPAQYERDMLQEPGNGSVGSISHYLCDLIGLGTPRLRTHVLPVGDRAARPAKAKKPDAKRPEAVLGPGILLYAGLLGQRPYSAIGLEGMLRDAFGIPVTLVQFRGAWTPLAEDQKTKLGERFAELGGGAAVGDEAWNPQAGVRVRLGPMKIEDYRLFKDSDTPRMLYMRRLVRFWLGDGISFDFSVELRAEDVPRCVPGTIDAELGAVAWLRDEPKFTEPARDLILKGDRNI